MGCYVLRWTAAMVCHRLPWTARTAMDCHGLQSAARDAMDCRGPPWTATQCILKARSSFGANAERYRAVVAAGCFAVETHEEASFITLQADWPEASNKKKPYIVVVHLRNIDGQIDNSPRQCKGRRSHRIVAILASTRWPTGCHGVCNTIFWYSILVTHCKEFVTF